MKHKRRTPYRDKHGKSIYEGDRVSGWFSAPWDEQVPIERSFDVRKHGRNWFCEGVENNDEDDFLKNFKHLEVIRS